MIFRRHSHAVIAVVFTLATVASFGPHLVMIGYHVAGVRPPAALLLLCPLHHLTAEHAPALVLHAKPLT